MKYPYHVKHDGVLYAPGEDVPVEKEEHPEPVTEEEEQPPRRRGRK